MKRQMLLRVALLIAFVRPALAVEAKDAKKFRRKQPLGWQASRRFSARLLEEYIPKLTTVMKQTREASDTGWENDWRRLGGQLVSDWTDSRHHNKKGDKPADQKQWVDDHKEFIKDIAHNGLKVMQWKANLCEKTGVLQQLIDDWPTKFAKFKKDIEEAESYMAAAEQVTGGGATAAEYERHLAKLDTAYNLAYRSGQGLATIDGVLDRQKSAAPPAWRKDVKEAEVRWRAIIEQYAMVDKDMRSAVRPWADVIKKTRNTHKKTHDKCMKLHKKVIDGTLFAGCAHFKDWQFGLYGTAVYQLQKRVSAARDRAAERR